MESRSFLDRLTGGKKDAASPDTAKAKSTPAHHHALKKTSADAEQCALDVYQTTDGLVIRAFIPGVRPEDLDISITNDTLTIRGIRTEGETIPPQDYYYRECYFGPFSRSVILPENSHGDTVKATLKHGILTIRLPKAEKKSIAITEH